MKWFTQQVATTTPASYIFCHVRSCECGLEKKFLALFPGSSLYTSSVVGNLQTIFVLSKTVA